MNIKKLKTQFSEELRKEARIKLRLQIITIGVCILFGVVMARAIQLHCIKNTNLQWLANKQYKAVIPQSSRRGRILDRDGNELAVSLPVPSVYADPRMVKLSAEEIARLAKILDMDQKLLEEKLGAPKKFVWLKRRVDRSVKEEIKGFPGIFSIEESKRFYPNGELASQILGAVGMDSDPLAGIELAGDKFLGSKKRDAVYRRDARGRFYFSPVAYEEQDDVQDIYLTIDKNIQFAAETALKKAATAANAKGGSVIVLDVKSGAILAMSNVPNFDPNDYGKYSQDSWRNRAITDSIEPGSTFKVLVTASALDAGVTTPETTYDCEKGAIKVGKAVLHDHNPYGVLSVTDIIKVSSNIGSFKVARELGKEKLYEYLKKFGIGTRTGIDFPGEVQGIVRPVAGWQPVEFATIAFGQGISATPIQLASSFASIANGGKLMKPYLVSRVVNNQGMVTQKGEPKVISETVSRETSKKVISMLEGVVGEGGTGTKAASKEYPVAGKTGTAQKVTEGSGRYAAGKYYASFIGLAPSNDPEIVIFAGLDEPKGSYYGGAVSAPIFKETAEATLKFMQVPSSLSQVVTAQKNFSVGTVDGDSRQGTGGRFHKGDGEGFFVPDLSGKSIRDVIFAVGEANINVKVEGSGLLIAQRPSAGGSIKEGETFWASFKQAE